MFVLTIDQRNSSHSEDLVEDLLRWTQEFSGEAAPTRSFERTAGDEIQGVYDDAAPAICLALQIIRTGNWSVGIGEGAVRMPLPAQTRAGAGPAFENARLAIERAKKTPGKLSFYAQYPHQEELLIDANLQLCAVIEVQRTQQRQEAGELYEKLGNQKAVAENLTITQPAVSDRLRSGLWQESRAVIEQTTSLMNRLNTSFESMSHASKDEIKAEGE